jgi:tetratricopeptide (TPR) repeat protein
MDEAISQYSEALRMIPYHAQACNNLGIAYQKKGELKKAQECFVNALEISPGFPDAARNYREVSSILAKVEQAAGKIEDALKDDSGNAALQVRLARLKLQAGDTQGAASAYRDAIALLPNAVEIMYELVLVYTGTGEYGQAIDLLRKMGEIRPDNPQILYNIACLYARQGKPDEAVSCLKQALDKGFDDIDLIRKDQDFQSLRETAFYRDLIEGAEARVPSPGAQ